MLPHTEPNFSDGDVNASSAAYDMETTDGPSTSTLPLELVLYIFDITTDISRETILSICQVASWAYSVYLPRLLRVINLVSDRQSRDFMARLPVERVAEHLPHVNTLWVDRGVQHAQHNPALTAYDMPNLRYLAVPYSLFTAMVLSRAVKPAIGLHAVLTGDVPELVLCSRALWDGHPLPRMDDDRKYSLDLPLLDAITHVRLTCPALGWRSPVFLCANVTHVAMPYCGAMGFNIPTTSLEMLVFVEASYRSSATHWDCRMRVLQARRGGRTIFSVTENDESAKDQWLAAVSGTFPSIWERARSQTQILEQLYTQCGGNWDAIQTLWQERSSKDDPNLSAISARGLTPRLRRL